MATAPTQQGPGPQIHGIRTNLEFGRLAKRNKIARQHGTGTPQLAPPTKRPRKASR